MAAAAAAAAVVRGALYTICRNGRVDQDAERSVGASYHSFSSGLLPSLGARSISHLHLRKYVLSPYDFRYR